MELTRLVSESPAVTLKGLFLLAASASPDNLTEILRPRLEQYLAGEMAVDTKAP